MQRFCRYAIGPELTDMNSLSADLQSCIYGRDLSNFRMDFHATEFVVLSSSNSRKPTHDHGDDKVPEVHGLL